jgi:dienelactone hydrolase
MRTPRTTLVAALASTLVLIGSACGSTEETVSTDTTAIPAATNAFAYAEPGPYPVGITTLSLPTGNKVEVWYPATEGTSGSDAYDMRDFVPEAVRALLTADVDATFTIDAGRDAAAADERFPVVLFSHGFSGIRYQSSFLTSHLASWGMVVAAPDHPSRDLASQLGGGATPTDPVDDMAGTLTLLEAENNAGGVLSGTMNFDHVGLVGHSAGGGTVLAYATSPAVDGYVSLASGARLGPDAEAGDTPTLPGKPSFFMAGTTDAVVPPETRTRPAFEAAPAPSLLWILEGVGHNGFDDFCTFGNGRGIIGVAEASGLGELLNAVPQLKALGADGCGPPSVPVDETFPVINHAVTSWLRSLFGVDAEPVGLGPEVADRYSVPVEIVVKARQ